MRGEGNQYATSVHQIWILTGYVYMARYSTAYGSLGSCNRTALIYSASAYNASHTSASLFSSS